MAYDPIPRVNAVGVAVWSAKVAGDSNNRNQITADGQMSWGPGNAAVDTFMSRSGVATVAFGEVDGAGAHTVLVYNTRSASGANYERLSLQYAANTAYLREQQAGTGVARNLFVGTQGASTFRLITNNVGRWDVGGSTGHFTAASDNVFDIGASAATRPRTGYFGTDLFVANAVNIDTAGEAVAAGDFSSGVSGGNRMFYDRSAGIVFIRSATGRLDFTDTAGANIAFIGYVSINVLETRNWRPSVSNIYDLGTTSNEWRVLHIGTSVIFGTGNNATIAAGSSAEIDFTASAQASGAPVQITFTGAAHTGMTASTEVPNILFDASATKQWATGAIAAQREFKFMAPTYGFVGASIITDAATLYVSGPPIAGTNATLTNTYAAWFVGDVVAGSNVPETLTSTFVNVFQGYDDASPAVALRDTNNNTEVILAAGAIHGHVGTTTNDRLHIRTNNVDTWSFRTEGHLVSLSANGYDIGSAIGEVRSVYVGTSVIFGTDQSVTIAAGGASEIDITQSVVDAAASPIMVTVTPAAHTALTVGDFSDIFINLARTVQWTTGAAIANADGILITAPTYNATAATQTITTAATLRITGAPVDGGANIAPTNTFALLVDTGAVRFGGTLEVITSVSVATSAVTLDTNGITMGDAKNIIINATTGTKIGTATAQKLSLWNATPIVQPSGTGETTGFVAGVGTGVNDDSTFTGNVGSKAYRISDMVKALKNLGAMAAS